MKRLVTIFLMMLLTVNVASAGTYSLVDAKTLPVERVNDPLSHENTKITRFSYEELEFMMTRGANFFRWNDGTRVCDSIQIMFGKKPAVCYNLPHPVRYTPEKHTYVLPKHNAARPATVSFTVGSTIKHEQPRRRQVMHVIPHHSRTRIWYPWG